MNRLFIIGNLTNEPELRTTPSGKMVCNFTVAVNRRQKDSNGNSIADFFRVSVWNQLGENCSKYLAKGRKVAVEGMVSLHTYTSNGKQGANLEVLASEVEFLSPRQEAGMQTFGQTEKPIDVTDQVQDDLPF